MHWSIITRSYQHEFGLNKIMTYIWIWNEIVTKVNKFENRNTLMIDVIDVYKNVEIELS